MWAELDASGEQVDVHNVNIKMKTVNTADEGQAFISS